MGRILTVVLGLGAILGAVWYVTSGTSSADPDVEATRQLDNVREAADRVEADLQQKADDLLKKTE
ncbi:hypothetical protein ACLESO_37420 [Pyxidicoccus sp. 3LG]